MGATSTDQTVISYTVSASADQSKVVVSPTTSICILRTYFLDIVLGHPRPTVRVTSAVRNSLKRIMWNDLSQAGLVYLGGANAGNLLMVGLKSFLLFWFLDLEQ